MKFIFSLSTKPFMIIIELLKSPVFRVVLLTCYIYTEILRSKRSNFNIFFEVSFFLCQRTLLHSMITQVTKELECVVRSVYGVGHDNSL